MVHYLTQFCIIIPRVSVGGAVVECSTHMRKVVSSNSHPDMEALGKASHSPAHGRRRMAALCQGTKQLSFT